MSRWKELMAWIQQRLASIGSGDSEEEQAHNSAAIAVSIVLAVVFWFTLKMQEEYPVAISLPTRVIQVPEQESLLEKPPSSVQVQVRGEGWQLLQLYYRRYPVLLDASNEEIDVLDAVRLSAGLPASLSIVSANPQVIHLPTGPEIVDRVPIELRAEISPARLYDVLDEPTLDPDTVAISGAQSLVESIESWPTQRVVREDVSQDLEFRVSLSDTLSPLIEKDTQETTVQVDVALFTEGIRSVPVRIRNIPPEAREVRLEPSEVRVIYRVPLGQYEEARSAEEFSATVEFSSIRDDTTGTVTPNIQVPENLVLRDVRVEPNELQYFTVIPSE